MSLARALCILTMRKLALLWFVIAVLPVSAAKADDFFVSKDWLFDARAEDLLASILAYDQACDHGCRYSAPHVERALILSEHKSPEDFFVWTFVKDVQNTSFFTHIKVTRSGPRIHVTLHLVGPKFAAELQRVTGKAHVPNFDDSIETFDLEEQTQDDRVQTRVHHENKLIVTGLGALFGASIIRDRLEESVRAMFENLRAVKAR